MTPDASIPKKFADVQTNLFNIKGILCVIRYGVLVTENAAMQTSVVGQKYGDNEWFFGVQCKGSDLFIATYFQKSRCMDDPFLKRFKKESPITLLLLLNDLAEKYPAP